MSTEAEAMAKMLEDWSASAKDAAEIAWFEKAEFQARAKALRQAADLIRDLSGRVERLEGALSLIHLKAEVGSDIEHLAQAALSTSQQKDAG